MVNNHIIIGKVHNIYMHIYFSIYDWIVEVCVTFLVDVPSVFYKVVIIIGVYLGIGYTKRIQIKRNYSLVKVKRFVPYDVFENTTDTCVPWFSSKFIPPIFCEMFVFFTSHIEFYRI
jgi:hypothetical protein